MEVRRIFVCTNLREASGQPSCAGRGSLALLDLLDARICQQGLPFEVQKSVCFGHCEKGPNVKAVGQPFRHGFKAEDIEGFLEALI